MELLKSLFLASGETRFSRCLFFFPYVYIMLHFVPVTVREICHGDSFYGVVYFCVLHIIVLHISSFLNFVQMYKKPHSSY